MFPRAADISFFENCSCFFCLILLYVLPVFLISGKFFFFFLNVLRKFTFPNFPIVFLLRYFSVLIFNFRIVLLLIFSLEIWSSIS
jgi:hypothetical protein